MNGNIVLAILCIFIIGAGIFLRCDMAPGNDLKLVLFFGGLILVSIGFFLPFNS